MSLREDWLRYRDARPRWVAAAEDTRQEVVRIAKAVYVPADVSARAKETGEFVRKALRKPYTDAWNQTTDKAGVRAVVEREAQVDVLLQAVLSDPTLIVVEGTVQDLRHKEPQTLEYGGVHLQVLAPSQDGDTEPLGVELQLRTKAQDLWSSVVSHRLLYKKKEELPKLLQKRLYNLLALMELFDQEVTRVIQELPSHRSFAQDKLGTAAETAYLSAHVREAWDGNLSQELLALVEQALGGRDPELYAQQVTAFAAERISDMTAVLQDYAGPAAEGDPHYVLFQQPEIVLIWERLSEDPDALRAAWASGPLPWELLEGAADVLGLPFEER